MEGDGEEVGVELCDELLFLVGGGDLKIGGA
jgi:hypothetical protein